ncbi:hypothetical protein J3458_000224 [Metarhizium acridum]|uniref:uncharacterized protein n=1 Tax=Metarhizium acridum TaxID=92637 RepID=UPI001C6AF160|nr:hypothetical protein J3458_000224 [Metarhizium acridum]
MEIIGYLQVLYGKFSTKTIHLHKTLSACFIILDASTDSCEMYLPHRPNRRQYIAAFHQCRQNTDSAPRQMKFHFPFLSCSFNLAQPGLRSRSIASLFRVWEYGILRALALLLHASMLHP